MGLSHKRILGLTPAADGEWHPVGDGLYLRVRSGARGITRDWYAREQRRDEQRWKHLGRYPEMLQREAKTAAAEWTGAGGGAEGVTVATLAHQFYVDSIAERYKRPKEVKRYLDRDIVPGLGNLRLDRIRPTDVRSIVVRKRRDSGPIAAARMLAITKKMFRHAVKLGYIKASPAQAFGVADFGINDSARDRALDWGEITAFWKSLEGNAHAPLMRFLMLTGQRIGEAQGMLWSEVDRDSATWTIPAAKTKSNREHWVHLSAPALAIVEAQPRNGDRVFGRCSDTAVQAWLKRECARRKWQPFTPHDLRRTLASRMAELGVDGVVIEKILNHSMQGVAAVYNRHDHAEQRRQALDRYAERVLAEVARP